MSPETAVYADLNALSKAAADIIAEVAAATVAIHGKFTMALSGGNTPRALFRLMAAEYHEKIPWAHAQIFFGDERCVTPNNADSNYRMARTELLELIPGLLSRTYRIEGELPPWEAAEDYEKILRHAFPTSGAPTFDILLLGIGTDGHTASLFPNSPALQEKKRWAVATKAPLTMITHNRVTLTYPILNAARNTLILCAGADKRQIIHEIQHDPKASQHYPIARITARDRLIWMMDQRAA